MFWCGVRKYVAVMDICSVVWYDVICYKAILKKI